MEGSRTSLRKWMLAFYLFSRNHVGTTATELASVIKVTYKTAWSILHKIRTYIHQADKQCLLSGSVEINAAIYGRPFNPSVHKHPQEHLLLVGLSSDSSNKTPTIKIKQVTPVNPKHKHITRSDIFSFQQHHIHPAVKPIETVTGFYTPKRLRPLLRIANQASAWINSTFRGIGAKHLQTYLDEFCYRVNLTESMTPVFDHLFKLCLCYTRRFTRQTPTQILVS